MSKKLLVILLTAFLLLPAFAGGAEELTYSGSTTIGKGVLEAGALKTFENKTRIKFKSIEYVGSVKGVQNLVDGKVNIAGTSRSLKEPERKQGVISYIIGYDAVGVYINKNNPVNSLSNEQLKGIFSGKIKNWKEVGGKNAPIAPIVQESKRATMEVFQEAIMGHDVPFGKNCKIRELPQDLLGEVAKDENGICPVSLGLWGEMNEKERTRVKALNIGNIEPTEKNVKSGAYKVSRPLILATKGLPRGQVKQFIDFMLSAEGQTIVAKNFVPVKR